jgi:predicted nuclease of predicted toxin-antitoxin system
MKFMIDENVSRRIAERLQQDGHVVTLAQQVALGQPDHEVLALAQRLAAIVLTEDNDFGDLVMRQHLPSAGVVLLRLSGMERSAQPDYIAQIIATNVAIIPDSFTVISPSGIRVRPLP